MTTAIPPEAKRRFFETYRRSYSVCLYPGGSCTNAKIDAHSIQDAQVLDRLQENGKVVLLKPWVRGDEGPMPEFTLVGRNEATIFRGLCGPHDTEIFDPIENSAIDLTNQRHRFLLAYRCVLKELYEKQRAFSLVASASDSMAPDVEPDERSPEFIMFARAFEDAYSFAFVKWAYDELYSSGNYSSLEHAVITNSTAQPVLAVSSLFGPTADIVDPNDRLASRRCVAYSVIPGQDSVGAVFSWLPSHRAFATGALERLVGATDYYQAYLLSKHILIHSENFVLSPRHYRTFSDTKRERILAFFIAKLFTQSDTTEDEHLYLF